MIPLGVIVAGMSAVWLLGIVFAVALWVAQ